MQMSTVSHKYPSIIGNLEETWSDVHNFGRFNAEANTYMHT